MTGAGLVASKKRTAVAVLGLLLAAFLAALLAPESARAVSAFSVNRTDDLPDSNLADNVCDTRVLPGNQCTLRAAIQQANATTNVGGPDKIRFALPGGVEPNSIVPSRQLPTITRPVIVDGYTQGDNTADVADDATENTATVGTNAVLKVVLDGSDTPLPSATEGLSGLRISGGGTTVRGLVITRFRRADNLANGEGILLTNVAGNTGNTIEGNFIGTDPSGVFPAGNRGPGVKVAGPNSTGNTVGGTALADRNLISSNLGDGVALSSDDNLVQGNLIGTDRETSSTDLGNGERGVAVLAGSRNIVGGTAVETANTVAYNEGDGVLVSAGVANSVLRNSIFSNTGLGIDLAGGTESATGVTLNDSRDTDAGPNGLQNRPDVTSATATDTDLTVAGTLRSAPDTVSTLRFFSSPTGNEGKRFLGQRSVTTNESGFAPFDFAIAVRVTEGEQITATATRAASTSEFSGPREVGS